MSDGVAGQTTDNTDRLAEAKESFREIQQEIAPFVKKRRFDRTTTAGQWRPTDAALTRQHTTAGEGSRQT